MFLKIEPDRLIKEELEYEIALRGLKPEGSVSELIKMLRGLLKLESEGQSFKEFYNFDAKVELDICSAKVDEIEVYLKEPFSGSMQRKIRTKLSHLLGRVERIKPSEQDKTLCELRSKLLTASLRLMSSYESKLMGDSKAPKSLPAEVEFEQSFLNQKAVSSTPTKNLSANVSGNIQNNSLTTATNMMQNLNVVDPKIHLKSLGIKYSGRNDSLSLNAFFERVNDIMEARGYSEEFMFRIASELFEGEALVYYRAVKSLVDDWKELIAIFRDEFFRDGDRKIFEQIKGRTQGETETIAIYVAYMQNLFNRLSFSVDEKVKLELIKDRIRPEYRIGFGLIDDINSLEMLIKLGRKLEDNKRYVNNFIPPSSNKHAIEVDLEYKRESTKGKLCNLETEKQVSFNDYKPSISKSENEQFSDDNRLRSRSRSNSRSRNRSNSRGSTRTRDSSKNRYCCSEVNYSKDGQYSDRNYSNKSYGSQHKTYPYQKRLNDDRSPSVDRNSAQNSKRPIIDQSDRNRAQNSFQDSSVVCFKCQGKNHLARHCTVKSIRCYNCGRFGFTKLNCPSCNLNH